MTWDPASLLVDVPTERAAACALISVPECREDIFRMLESDDFTDRMARTLFVQVKLMTRAGLKVDMPSVLAALDAAKRGGEVDRHEMSWLCDPAQAVSNAMSYASYVRESGLKRRILRRLDDWRSRVHSMHAGDLLGEIERFASESLDDVTDDVRISGFADVLSTIPDVAWLWDGWLPRGFLTVLASAPGEGKSALALEIVRRVVAGGAWPDGAPASPGGTVLYVDTEAAGAILRRRVAEWGIPTEGLKVFAACGPGATLAEMSLDEPRDWGRLYRGVMEMRPSLVVIDSLSGAHAREESSSGIRVLLLRFARLARDSGAAFLVVHHLRKRSPSEPDAVTLDRLRGSGALAQLARSVWAVDRPDPADPRRRLAQVKNNLSEKPAPIGFTIGPTGLAFTEAPSEPRDKRKGERAAEFLRAVLQPGRQLATDILAQGKAGGISESWLHTVAKSIGVVKERDPGDGKFYWRLADGEEMGGANSADTVEEVPVVEPLAPQKPS